VSQVIRVLYTEGRMQDLGSREGWDGCRGSNEDDTVKI
jgi:hypothetical protein